MKNLQLETVLITGASSGIGKELAYQFARNEENLEGIRAKK
jgi:short-subunit dehydrogenase